MDKAKSKGFISLFVLLILSIIMMFVFATATPALAASAPDTSRYFSYAKHVQHAVSDIKFENNYAVLPMSETEEVSFVKAMVIDDYKIVMDVPVDEVKEFNYNVPMSSYVATGNLNAENSYDTTIANKINFKVNSDNFSVSLNGESAGVPFNSLDSSCVEISLKVVDNILVATIGSTEIPAATDDYYKVKVSDKPISTMSIEVVSLADDVETANVSIQGINTKASSVDSVEYQQTFQLDATGSGFNKYARPRYVVNEAFINSDGKVSVGEEYTVSTTAYSFMGTTTTCYLTVDEDEVGVTIFGSAKKGIKFSKPGTYTFYISVVDNTDPSGYADYEEYTVTAVKEERNGKGNAPVYNGDAAALASFKAALEKSLYADYEEKIYIGLGTDQYLELPSFESIVSDDLTTYKNLTATIYYKTPDSSSTYSSGYKIPITKAGKYSFYVVFKDKNGNSMNDYDFISDESLPLSQNTALYKDYVFEFELFDNAELTAEAMPQGKAFVDVEYTATNFNIVASDNTKAYKLYYSATGEDNTWYEVVLASSATDEDETYNGFTYDDVKTINYTGELTFTPHAKGYYKLACVVNSSSSTRWVAAEAIIESDNPITVGTAKQSSTANVPQIIFLSVGGVCFAGIIALFFVKPKNKDEE